MGKPKHKSRLEIIVEERPLQSIVLSILGPIAVAILLRTFVDHIPFIESAIRRIHVHDVFVSNLFFACCSGCLIVLLMPIALFTSLKQRSSIIKRKRKPKLDE